MRRYRVVLKNIFIGAGRVLELWPHSDYVRPSRDGFRRDAEMMRNDFSVIFSDFRKSIDRYDKQIHLR